MPSPKTATITMTIVNDDGSKTILETADLDASKLPANRYTRATDSPEHIVVGMVDPWHDDSDWYRRRDYFVDNFRKIALPPPETHFNLQLQLPPVNSSGHVYTIREVEAPLKRVVMHVMCDGSLEVKQWSEEYAQGYAEAYNQHGRIVFFLDIP